MSEPLLIERQRQLIRELAQQAAERARAEAATDVDFVARNDDTETRYQQRAAEIKARFGTETDRTNAQWQERRREVETRFVAEHSGIEQKYEQAQESTTAAIDAEEKRHEKGYKEARWTTNTVYEANKKRPKQQLIEVQRQLNARVNRLKALGGDAIRVLARYKQSFDEESVVLVETPPAQSGEDPFKQLTDTIGRADDLLLQLKGLRLPKLFQGINPAWVILALAAVFAWPAGWMTGQNPLFWLATEVGLTAVAGLVLIVSLHFVAGKKCLGIYNPLCQALADGEVWAKRCLEHADAVCQRQRKEIKQKRDDDYRVAKEKFGPLLSDCKRRREEELRRLAQEYVPRLEGIRSQHDIDLRQADEHFPRAQTELRARYEQDLRDLETNHRRELEENQARHEHDWQTLIARWRQALAEAEREASSLRAEVETLCPNWHSEAWDQWRPATNIPPGLRFGQLDVALASIPQGVSEHSRVTDLDLPTHIKLPALVPFPEGASLLVRTRDAGRRVAVSALQTVMLRLLTTVPLGKIRFTIIDPVGLGQNFAAFMHLADYDEAMVNSRIWTERAFIEQRLADLTGHMENVIQKYLRNEYPSIEDYNRHAGEVAEPYRILVVANFPENFTEAAARRLVSVASSGPRCGVYTLVSVDMRQKLPPGIKLSDLQQHAVVLNWNDDGFQWRNADFEPFTLRTDTPPEMDRFKSILKLVGTGSKDASRVEVPFEFIAPAADRYWSCDSRSGVNVPLGRAGATKLQYLRLGKGTSQHVLIAGKTGSGKSTLLHALITNVALYYSPEEIELYLIDFKKGVEFKTYAAHELPHARVIAIESEREFGLSVMQRLDAELKIRGDKFRELAVQDVASYREANGSVPLPRILLIVDEFQEFFTEDDKIAQEAALLLDRLVRQGRAFGIHVHLGSQTLGGAYSLARSTIGQMAVRIALQCSEADAHLILSEDNTAARLLSRPGEAIYNDANGLIEGNNPFQVVWLSDDRKERYLEQIQQMARERNMVPRQPQIVFEGNKPAEVEKNGLLQRLVEAQVWPEMARSAMAWLGEALAIKDPTNVVFRAQSGNNLLLLGQHDEAALAMMAMSLVSLAAQFAPGDAAEPQSSARFYILDAMPSDAPNYGYLGRLASLLPHAVKVVSNVQELPAVISEVCDEVERRQAAGAAEAAPIFLFVYDIARLRPLRKQEDDFSFSRSSDERKPKPDKQFGTILREGPPLGVHSLVWCDTLTNFQRTLDRQGLREFENRVLFQMSANDSSTLIDSPAASKLGRQRAYVYSEEQTRLEKFRPYGLPTDSWLSWIQAQFHARPVPVRQATT